MPAMMELDEILCLARDREAASAEFVEALRTIDRGYEGDLDVDLPDLRRKEKVAVANMLVQGVDQHGMRIASTMMDPDFPPLRATSAPSVDRASRRRRAVLGWWDENGYDVMTHRRARWLIAYAMAPVQIMPRRLRRGDSSYSPDNTWTVEWRLRLPHETLPAPCANPDDMTPGDCIFRYSQPLAWLLRRYPEGAAAVRTLVGYSSRLPAGDDVDRMVELIEYVDGEETVLAAMGTEDRPVGRREADYGIENRTITYLGGSGPGNRVWGVELTRYPNRTGLCPVVIPSRITLGKLQGQFDQMIGIFEQQALLMALELQAVTRSVFPDTYATQNPNENLVVEPADGLRGKLGKIKGGTIANLETHPGYQVYPTIDRLSEAMRVQALIPPDFGGQSGSNIRTARRGADIISSTVDFSLQEAQLLFERSGKHEITRGIETAKAYFGTRPKVYAVAWPGAKGMVDYRPVDIFEEGAPFTVNYAAVGSDANMLNVNLQQSVGSLLMSKMTARRKHPDIENPEFEDRQVQVEGLREALIGGLEQQMAAGSFPIPDGASIIKALADGTAIEDAIAEVHKLMQERQATSGEPGTPAGPVAPGSPEAQSGMAVPGAGAEAGVASIPAPVQGLTNLVQQIRQSRTLQSAAGG